MGDICEFTTWPNHLNIFYKVTSCSIVFYAKGSGNAAIGLSERPDLECEYWILLGFNDECSIQKNGKLCSHVSAPDILSEEKYRRFWISWFNGELRVGGSRYPNPLLYQQINNHNLQYVTFSVVGDRECVCWKICLPPHIEKPMLRNLGNDDDVYWASAEEQLPDGSLIGGHENETLYIIRAYHQGSLTPGKFVPSLGLGFISWGGYMHEKNNFEVLCGYNYTWVKTSGNRIPKGAIEAGYSENCHETLYVGRAILHGHLIPGKVQPSYNCCLVPHDGREVNCENYEILVKPKNTLEHETEYSYLKEVRVPDPYTSNYSDY